MSNKTDATTDEVQGKEGTQASLSTTRHEKRQDNPGINSELKPKDVDRQLDKALMDSFPTSDPPALSQPTGTEPAGDTPEASRKP